jgi:Zn-dependent protease
LLDLDYGWLLISFLVLVCSLTVHETAHAWTADRLGDPTARLLGRVSLNPIVHVDLLGTVLLPLVAFASGMPIIGWAKPVPVNPRLLRDPRRDFVAIAAAGPASNVALAIVAALALRAVSIVAPAAADGMAGQALTLAIFLNVLLALFNLVPVPPLDGGNVLAGLIPEGLAFRLDRTIRPYGFLVLYALLFTGALNVIVFGPARSLTRMLLP